MIRKLVCMVLSVFITAGIGITAQARSGRGELQVIMEYEDEAIHDGEVSLYPVGNPVGNDFLLATDFGGGMIKREDIKSAVLAVWLTELADTEGIKRILDADGRACYSGLPEGLYLIQQSQTEDHQEAFDPILVSIPTDGVWTVGVLPKSRVILTEAPKTGQFMSPLIGAMGLVLSILGLCACVDRIRRK